ncbi:polysaccharide biosynthesis/export family protein [candidate division TA06 bacterium]|nr:polysaccharide biosynthesis/export family protein [candidate division TA06 bacterium]
MHFFRAAARASSKAALVFGIAALLGAGSWALAQEQGVSPAARQSSAPSGYVIGPMDVLQIVVWKEPDLTREVTVRLDGMITLPLLGDLQAAGRAPKQLAESLEKALERYIEAPRVAVLVSRATSARFYVVGQVARSGEFPLSGSTTVLQGLALAGGFREFAKPKNIVVIRRDGTVIPFNFERIADGKDMSQNVVLEPGDTILVPFQSWTVPSPDSTSYLFTVCTDVVGDEDTTNNCGVKPIFAYIPVGVEEENNEYRMSNLEFRLFQNHPNPFHSFTLIRYNIPVMWDQGSGDSGNDRTPVKLMIYDLTGRLVETLVDEVQKPGVYTLSISKNQLPSSGVYFYRLTTSGINESGPYTTTKKLILFH